MLITSIPTHFFFENLNQLLLFALIVLTAGIVRGCIGFGFSAILVASTSFWLPPVAVVNLAVLLEIVASLSMMADIREDIKPALLVPLSLGALLTTFVGIWLLSIVSSRQFQWITGIYLLIVATLTLIDYQFKGEITKARVFSIGLVSGFFNGLAAIGGVFAAWAFVGSKLPVKTMRATFAVYFILVEILFLLGSVWNGLLTAVILRTTLLTIIPLVIGTWVGAKLFQRLPEATLKRFVLVALIVFSLIGIYKTVF